MLCLRSELLLPPRATPLPCPFNSPSFAASPGGSRVHPQQERTEHPPQGGQLAALHVPGSRCTDPPAPAFRAGHLVFSIQQVHQLLVLVPTACAGPLAQNVLDSCVGSLCWYAVGYGFAFATKAGTKMETARFIGNANCELMRMCR